MAPEVKWKTGWHVATEMRGEKEVINNWTKWQGMIKYNKTLKEPIGFKIRKILGHVCLTYELKNQRDIKRQRKQRKKTWDLSMKRKGNYKALTRGTKRQERGFHMRICSYSGFRGIHIQRSRKIPFSWPCSLLINKFFLNKAVSKSFRTHRSKHKLYWINKEKKSPLFSM